MSDFAADASGTTPDQRADLILARFDDDVTDFAEALDLLLTAPGAPSVTERANLLARHYHVLRRVRAKRRHPSTG